MIIPAAGPGSRLGTDVPKILVEVNGRPMIDHLFDLYEPHVSSFVLVLHPSFEGAVRDHCRTRSVAVECALQEHATGMLDAILVPQGVLRSRALDGVWITWCDQVAVQPDTAAHLAEACDRDPGAEVILPTITRRRPYIHLVRNERDEIVTILHEREGDSMPETGESDMGLFGLSSHAYFELLPRFAREVRRGSGSGERNFLPFLCWLAGRGRVQSLPGHHEMESVGVNTPEDHRLIEAYLRHG
jgi:bifunctional N-acetylglucosamine-1-phosphate-uridyltransferase/glucosamine-1-phosphate-acetyltransferase GlmU-like protein